MTLTLTPTSHPHSHSLLSTTHPLYSHLHSHILLTPNHTTYSPPHSHTLLTLTATHTLTTHPHTTRRMDGRMSRAPVSHFGEIGNLNFKGSKFEIWSSQTKDLNIDTCRLIQVVMLRVTMNPSNNQASGAWGKDWLAHCQHNVTEWDIWSWCLHAGLPVGQHYKFVFTITSRYPSWYDLKCC